jgi:hypothetical protein
MANKGDLFPHAQDKFVDFTQQFTSALNDVGSDLNLSAAIITAHTAKQSTFMTKWTALKAAGKSPSNDAARKTLIAEHQKYYRDFYNKNIRYSDGLTDEIRRLLGVPIPDTTHSHITVGDHHVGFELAPKAVYQVGMKCWDEETGEKKILYGMSGIVALYAITPEPLTAVADLTESVLITKTSHIFTGVDGQRGKWISVTCCWQSKTGERGPWVAIQSTVIP